MELKNVSQGHQNARAAFRASIRTPVPVQPSRGRREVLQLGIALPLLAPMPAFADVLEAQTPGSDAAAAALSVPAAPKPAEVFLDLEFQVVPPASFKFVDTQPIYDPNRRGPAPEPSPVRARFDSPDGSTVLSVIVRNAQSIRPSILQVVLPPKQTALGPVELPPKNYYRYEFTTTSGLHVVMTAAAMKGKVFVCGGSTSAGTGWEKYGAVLREATESFHLRSDNLVL
ncbi:hypothetical protein Vretimale_7490 [Volvox reticuliferus]|uniref:PsbP C-terminal domain-containing protein n=1 Tax=Volvox reticuliferus TaxID=1737510 RepID=A0A8J4LN85_9CHLO|nr:hypothetical protein Vretimale_7490 [Volvox reticuliferus]